MRRKIWLATAAVVAVAVTTSAVAIAAGTQVNTYRVEGSMKGAKGATKKKPKPIQVEFNYYVGEESGLRPSPVKTYSIFFSGLQVNNSAFPGCDEAKLTDAGDAKVCPKGSLMGSGRIINEVGQPSNLSDKSLYCYLVLTTINSTKKNHFLLFLKGVQSDPDPKKTCVTQVSEPIDAKFVKKNGGTALEFDVPANLLHPASLDNAVTNVQSVIRKVTTKKKGKTIGFFESISCTSKQKISVTFTQESDGRKSTAETPTKCTK